MEATGLSIGKSVLNGALSYAKSALAEEVALQLGFRRDQLFITNELEMMQAFLMAAHDERVDNMVAKVWVKQVRDVAYDVEDTLQEFAVRLRKQSWWRIRRALVDRRRVAKQMKELRASVEDVSQRNMRYHLIKGSSSNPTVAAKQPSITSAALFGIDGARLAAKQGKSKVDLVQLINDNKKESDLRVIAVWGTSTNLCQTTIIRAVYENPDIKSKFSCRAWVRLIHPFNPQDFIQSLVGQFHTGVGAKVLLGMEMTTQELAEKFDQYVNEKRYLIVLNGLSTIEEWDRVKSCFPNNKTGSRIIVSTTQVEVASLCAGQESIVSELKQLSVDQTIYAFHEKVSQDGIDFTKTKSSSNRSTIGTDENSMVLTRKILEDQSKVTAGKNTVKKSFNRIKTMVTAFEEAQLVGREKEKSDIIKLVSNQATKQFQLISVWGMGGLGKTTLVKDIYESQELSGMFEKRAFVTVMRPFVLEELLRSLVMQLDRESSKRKDVVGLMGSTRNILLLMPIEALIKELGRLLGRNKCLIVLDDVSSTTEWDTIIPIFHELGLGSISRIIVTTREENIAKHCSERKENIYKLKGLEYKDAHDLFTKKVFKGTIDLDKQYPELVEQAELILRKCKGLPLAIVTIGGFLANQPKTSLEWRKLNEHISAELEMNPELETIRTVLMRSYDGLPYHLKSCFLYMSIFREDQRVGRGRLVRRWTAEGYSKEVRGKSMEEIADGYFMELISRSIILPSPGSIHSTKGIDSCQVHDLMREIGISKSIEENIVFMLEEGCSSNNQAKMRHLAINSNWKGEENEFKGIVDMSRVRSVTVFGEFKSFFISNKMSLLRVLDLEDTTGLRDHHIKDIGKLLHLRYLSLRGCDNIYHLPDSLGNLKELLTLDVSGTCIIKMPKGMINLQKLNNLCAGLKPSDDYNAFEGNRTLRYMSCVLSLSLIMSCLVWCAPQLYEKDDFSRRDACTFSCCFLIPAIAMGVEPHGLLLPKGVRKLKSLRTLGIVNIARRGKGVLKDIKGLSQLRKLGVNGVNKENGQELCSAIVGLSHLESLSIQSEGCPGLCGCLHGRFSFPENLQKLRLYGNLEKLPKWIVGLKNLVKLKLRSSWISEHGAAMQVLGNLSNLASLHLLKDSFTLHPKVHLNFCLDMFPSLVVLELRLQNNSISVRFEEGAAPKLELFKLNIMFVSSKLWGLPYLSGLKEVVLMGRYDTSELEYVRAELALNPNRPVLKIE